MKVIRPDDEIVSAPERRRLRNDASPPASQVGLSLRALADTYENVQKIRIECGERIRAVAQGRAAGACSRTGSATALLERIRAGETDGPIPALGQTFRLHNAEERRLRKAMNAVLADHPAWPWLESIRGVGPTLAAKLLGRLDIHRAPTPSSFWSYCGLATVPGKLYRCEVCGLRKAFPRDARVAGGHSTEPGSRPCEGRLELVAGHFRVRVAPPRHSSGSKRAFDPTARRICYQLGVSLLRAGGGYADFYRQTRADVERSARGWTAGHVHMASLRRMEKRFLAHLWVAWAESAGLPPRASYSIARLHRNGTSRGNEVAGR